MDRQKKILPRLALIFSLLLIAGCSGQASTQAVDPTNMPSPPVAVQTENQPTSGPNSSPTASTINPVSATPDSTTATLTTSANSVSPENGSFETKVPVLMFHYVRIVDQKKDPVGYDLSIEPPAFEAMLKYLHDAGYHTIHATDLLQKKVSAKSIVLTFDDGYEDFYTTALPLLKKYNFTASEAIITGMMDGKQYMTPEQVKSIEQQGIEILSHTVHHVDLSKSANAAKELSDSKATLEQLLGHPVRILVYPSGRYNDQTIKLATQDGYQLAFTTKSGFADLTSDLFQLPRIRIDNRVSLKSLMKRLP